MKKIFLALILVAVPLGLAADGDIYNDPPAEGGFNQGVSASDSYSYKAGEFTVEVGGVLPPTQEKLNITSGGVEEGWQEVEEIDGMGVEDWVDYLTGITEDEYYAWQPGKPGLYKYRLNATLGSYEKKYDYDFDDEGVQTESHSTSLVIFKDERVVCNDSMYDSKVNKDYGDEGSVDVYSEICGYYDILFSDGGLRTLEQNKEVDDSYDHSENQDGFVSEWEYTDVGDENNQTLIDVELDAPEVQTPEPGEEFSDNNSKNYFRNGSFRIKNQAVEPKDDDRKDGDIVESINVYRDAASEESAIQGSWGIVEGWKTDLDIHKFSLNYIDPIGSTLIRIGDRKFTGNVESTSDYEDTLQPSDYGQWRDTPLSFQLDVEGNFEDLSFDDPKRLILEGEYRARSATGVYPEGYRWYNVDTNNTIASYTAVDSSKGPWVQMESDIDLDSSSISSGEVVLQVNTTTQSYPVDVGVRDFTARLDEYIRYGDSRVYNPQLKTGSNTVEINTSNSNTLSYRFDWHECHDPIVSVEPSNNSYVSTSPLLSANTSCPSLDNVTFRDANTDQVFGQWEDVPEGTELSADTDLTWGETYEWYIKACDQGACYSTDNYEFTVGEAPDPDEDSTSPTEYTTQALQDTIRDEDFNPFGDGSALGTPLSKGYINKLEEQSNQLEPTMDTDTLEDFREGPVSNWSNSQGGENSADQFAITKHRNWSISNRGVPYPPWGSYYRYTADRRTSIDDDSVHKTEKVFANSLAVVADEQIDEGGETIAKPGQGVWIDPDQIAKTKSGGPYEYPGNWYELLDFNLDITGPDSGLGYDNNESDITYQDGRKVVRTDIYFKKED